MGKLKLNFLRALAEAINSLTRNDLADLRIPEYVRGEVLTAGDGMTCIVLEVHPRATAGIEYTILWDGEIHEHVLETSLTDWDILSEVEQDPFMLTS